MAEKISLSIDGAIIRASKGSSVLDAALNFGICIPHLCHLPGTADIGACRLCIVEHIQNGRSKITTSCTLNVREGMEILSNTERIRKLRRNIAELLVAEAPNSRAVQDVAMRCGVKEVRYPFRNNDCILCGRCIRACTGRFGEKAIDFVGRGMNRRVMSPLQLKSELCRKCGWCADVCPMTMTPCSGPMLKGEERLCGNCESKQSGSDWESGYCIACYFGQGFQCQRHPEQYTGIAE